MVTDKQVLEEANTIDDSLDALQAALDEIERLRAEVERLRAALKFYADEDIWRDRWSAKDDPLMSIAEEDLGDRARAALSTVPARPQTPADRLAVAERAAIAMREEAARHADECGNEWTKIYRDKRIPVGAWSIAKQIHALDAAAIARRAVDGNGPDAS